MNAILGLPQRDELQLTAEELERMTGTPVPRLQIHWLESNGWKFIKTRAGVPVVGRLYANLKMGGVEMANIVAPEAWEPDFSSVQ
ncbi:DUF4224 domain-containing protein [Paucibacter sp. APW11]|uniref:DUF4224 domain-containing protein n=1 Tax=Roseateles aquae TaxID=3077235 RepID=A0ABU3P787_9BURK|nr:DUF4224 domain-containing protein [Paucibacter sp. APW11]MDT8998383.1 DUF4224 domain-containing protein [Paucibacter sp. APW11]